LEAGGGVAAGLALGEAEFFSGRHDEAERVLAGLETLCRDDEERAAVTNARVYNLGMLMGDAGAADAVLSEALVTIVEPAPRLRLLARRGIDRLYAGDLASALSDSEELIAVEDPETASRGTYVRSIALAALGLSDEAIDTAYSGFEIAKSRAGGIQPAQSQLLGAILAHAGAGHLERAELDARATYDDNIASGNLEGASTFGLLLGWVLVEKGHCVEATRMLRESAAINREINDVPNLRFALGGLALAEAMSGHQRESSAAVEELEGMPPHWMTLLDPDLIDRGRAWSMVAAGEVSGARTMLLASAEQAAGRRLHTAEAKLRHDLVRLGEGRAQAERLAELAARVDGSLVRAFVSHAEASWHRSGPELERCASEFASMDAQLLAAEVYREASEAFQRDALRRQAASTARLSAELREGCGPVSTPLLGSSEGAVMLTRREREVASLAASGLSSREIADRLYVSVRTVDNQLQRVYNKLGVSGRDGLREALAVY
jgi:DNA-binding CsgD family transcriptional regulator